MTEQGVMSLLIVSLGEKRAEPVIH
jgi:hypothetical protein